MAVTTDMMRTWRRPRAVMRELLAHGAREDRALAYLMAACVVIFIAQWPRLSRMSAGFDLAPNADVPELSQLIAYEMLGWLMVWPLLFYGIAAVSHLVAKLLGGQGTWFTARLALFWALLAATPAALLYGLTVGLIGPGNEAHLVGAIWIVAFIVIWVQSLREAQV